MLDCLDNIIGVDKTCAPQAPKSGLYIQDLPGIDLKVADAVINSDYASGVRFLLSKIEFAKNLMLAQVRSQLQDKLRYGTILSNENIGYVDYSETIPADAGSLTGIQINVLDYSYFELYLQSFSVFATESKTINVYVYDLITGSLLDTFEAATIANTEVNVQVNKTYYSQRKDLNLFICTSNNLGHYQARLTKRHCSSCSTGVSNGYANINASAVIDSLPIIDRNLQGATSTGGLSISYSLSCSLEPFLCNMAGMLGFPLLYKAGSAIMDEAINTGRLNGIVLTKKEDWQTLKEDFEAQYISSIRALMSNIKLPEDICFSCNNTIRKVIQIP